MAGPELEPRGPEQSGETKEAAGKQLEKLRDQGEKAGEHLNEDEASRASAERARDDAEKIFGKDRPAGEKKAGGEPTGSAPAKKVTKKDRAASYTKTMDHVQEEMSAPARAFSKVIHNPAVEKTSEVVGSTIARPNAILAGSITAFVLVSIVYFVARNMGYELSGSETIVAFVFGWLLGTLFDFLKVMVTGKR